MNILLKIKHDTIGLYCLYYASNRFSPQPENILEIVLLEALNYPHSYECMKTGYIYIDIDIDITYFD